MRTGRLLPGCRRRRTRRAASRPWLRPSTGALAPRITPDSPPQDPPDLGSTVYAIPLTVVAAAYLALVDPGLRPSTTADLLEGLLAHEDRY